MLHRLPDWVLGPLRRYERIGDVPNVVFPCGLVHDQATDEIRLYYGAADTSICLATAQLGDLLDAVLAAARLSPARRPAIATVFAAARFSERRSLSDFCAGFLPVFFGFCEPFIV